VANYKISGGKQGAVGDNARASNFSQKNKDSDAAHQQPGSAERIAIFIFGVAFVLTLLALAIKFPEPTPFQYTVFRIVLALAAAGVAALIPGFIQVQYRDAIRAGGALAVFVIVYFFSPASLVIH